MKFRLVVLLLVASFTLVAESLYGAPLAIVDQQNTIADGKFFSGQNIIGQSFVPSLAAIDAIEFDLGALTGGVNTYINLRGGLVGADGLGGPILGTTNTIALFSDAPVATRHFDFPSRITLTPGNKYVAELVSNNGNAGSLSFNDRYPAGEGLVAFSPGWDMIFREGLSVPEPAAGLLAISAVCAWSVATAGRRRLPQ